MLSSAAPTELSIAIQGVRGDLTKPPAVTLEALSWVLCLPAIGIRLQYPEVFQMHQICEWVTQLNLELAHLISLIQVTLG